MVGAGAAEGSLDASQHAQADAGARRAAHHRRDHARRVPQAHREGRGARAALPAGAGRRADGRGHDQHPARAARALRDPPRREAQGLGAGGGGGAVAPLHRRPLPARQGHRPGGRGGVAAAHGDRLDAGGARRGRAPRDAARDRARGAAQGEGQGVARAAREAREGAGRPQGEARPAEGAVGAGEGRDPADAQAQGRARSRCGSRSSGRSAAGDYAKASELQYGRLPQLEKEIQEREAHLTVGHADAEGGSRRGRHRRGRQPLDAHPRQQADGGRDPEAARAWRNGCTSASSGRTRP